MRSAEARLRRLAMLEERIDALFEVSFPEEEAPASRLTLADRPMVIRFMRDVHHGGMDEHVWAAKYPDDYRRLAKICGTVPAAEAIGPQRNARRMA